MKVIHPDRVFARKPLSDITRVSVDTIIRHAKARNVPERRDADGRVFYRIGDFDGTPVLKHVRLDSNADTSASVGEASGEEKDRQPEPASASEPVVTSGLVEDIVLHLDALDVDLTFAIRELEQVVQDRHTESLREASRYGLHYANQVIRIVGEQVSKEVGSIKPYLDDVAEDLRDLRSVIENLHSCACTEDDDDLGVPAA